MGGNQLTLFYSYAHEDETLRDELGKHLKLMERQGILRSYSDRQILPGSDWRGEIDANLQNADIVLLLISPDFLASDYCYDTEMAVALRRHNLGQCVVVPVILRSVDFTRAPFARLQALPSDARPVTLWEDQDAALLDVAKGIRKIADGDGLTSGSHRGAAGGPGPVTESDRARIRSYRDLFDRRAFYIPCIFENGMSTVKAACKQIAFAMMSGRVLPAEETIFFPEGIPLYDVAKRSDFESDFYRDTLSQVGRYIAAIERVAGSLRVHLLRPGSGAEGAPLPTVDEPGLVDIDLGTFLTQMIDAGASVRYVREAFSMMDQVDSARNAVLTLLNSLLAPAQLTEFEMIPLSSVLLEQSAHIREYDWEHFYLSGHESIRRFLAGG